MRTWIIACFVVLLLCGILLRVEYRLTHPTVPPGLQRSDCIIPLPEAQNGNDRFSRLGGRTIRYPNAQWQGDFYTVPNIAEGRKLEKYDKLEIRDSVHLHPWEWMHNPIIAQARRFLWEHWQGRQRAYLILTGSSVDRTSTWHIFVEADDSGRWRIYRRHLAPGELVDPPTVYSLNWVKPNGWESPGTPIPTSQKPDPFKDELEFRDVCGERLGDF